MSPSKLEIKKHQVFDIPFELKNEGFGPAGRFAPVDAGVSPGSQMFKQPPVVILVGGKEHRPIDHFIIVFIFLDDCKKLQEAPEFEERRIMVAAIETASVTDEHMFQKINIFTPF